MLEVEKISKVYGNFSLNEVSFTVGKGDYFILLGESGAGKSLVLETIAGLILPDAGSIRLNGQEITRVRIQQRGIGMVFQDHAVFPHLTVGGNLAYSLHGTRLTRETRRAKVLAVASELGIAGLLDRHPATLSGGEMQRVALGRALVQEPAILLLDEPLSSLDAKLRTDLRRLLRRIHRSGRTILHVTHDYTEALSLGTRIAVIHKGTIIQEGIPGEVFNHPKSEFVAHFIGARNFFPARLDTAGPLTHAILANGIKFRILSNLDTGEGYVMIRPEDVLVSAASVQTSATNSFPATIVDVVRYAGGMELTLDAGFEVQALVTPESYQNMQLTIGNECWIHFKASAIQFIPE